MKKTILTLALFGFFFNVNAQAVVFDGGAFNIGTDWGTPANWDGDVLPGSGDNVEIPSGYDVIVAGTFSCQQIKISGSATLTVMSSGTLDIDGGPNDGIDQTSSSGNISNAGTINIENAGEQGIACKGIFTNDGTINIDNNTLHGLRVQGGNFTNNSGGIINTTVDTGTSDQDALAVDDNSGTGGTFTNDGEVNVIMTTSDDGIDITDGSHLINNGDLNISGGGADMGIKLRKANSMLTNNGTLTIEDTPDESIFIEGFATMINNGTIDISNSPGHGIHVDEGSFTNSAGALYKAISVQDGIRVEPDGNVTNSGDMWLDLCSGDEIEIDNNNGASQWVNTGVPTFHPGSSPGQMEIKNDFDFGDACVTFEISGTSAESTYDQIDHFGGGADGTPLLTISGATAKLDWGTYVPEPGDCFKLIDGSGSISGTWASVTSTNSAIVIEEFYDTDADTEWEICVQSIVLPVDLANFNAEKDGKNVQLNWETSNEVNNEGFDVERSIDGDRWTQIGKVRGAGNSSKTEHYTFTDSSPVEGSNYYRLKQNDFDGDYEYSEVREVRFENVRSSIKLYPNPVNNILNIEADLEFENTKFQLFDSHGKLLTTMPSSSTQIPFTDYLPGVYYLEIVSPEDKTIYKIIND